MNGWGLGQQASRRVLMPDQYPYRLACSIREVDSIAWNDSGIKLAGSKAQSP